MTQPDVMYLPQEVLLPQEAHEPGSCESGIALVPGAARAAGGTGDALLVLEGFRQDLSQVAWEADVLGVGVWLQAGSGIREIVPPAAWRQQYVKAAGWRFRERAYNCWLSARPPEG